MTVDEVAAMGQIMGVVADGLEGTFAGRKQGKAAGARHFRSVFGHFVRTEAEAAVGRVKVDGLALREAVRCEAAAAAMLSASEVPGAERLAGAVSVKHATERAGLMTGMREAVEMHQGVGAWSGKRLPSAEITRRRAEIDPMAMHAARDLMKDPLDCIASRSARGWMNDPAADVLVKARGRSGSDMER